MQSYILIASSTLASPLDPHGEERCQTNSTVDNL